MGAVFSTLPCLPSLYVGMQAHGHVCVSSVIDDAGLGQWKQWIAWVVCRVPCPLCTSTAILVPFLVWHLRAEGEEQRAWPQQYVGQERQCRIGVSGSEPAFFVDLVTTGLTCPEEDKRERRRKLGLPEEPPEAESAAADAQAASTPAQPPQRSNNAPPAPRASLAEQFRQQLVAMKKSHLGEEERVKTCWATLLKYCGNIAQVRSHTN